MSPLVLVIVIGLGGGLAVGVQGPLASMITQRTGPMESAFIVHLGGALAALIPLALAGGGRLGEWRNVPWYALGAGALGLIVISAISFIIPRMGVGTTVVLLVVGQLLTSAVLDHFGWLGAAVRPVTAERLLGMIVLVIGAWLVVR